MSARILVPLAKRPLGLLLTILGSVLALTAPAKAVTITVYPANVTVEQGATLQCTAYVPMTPSTVQWLVNDVVGGSATFGTVSATGLYAAPAVIPAANVITIKARSTATPSVFGTITPTIVRKYPSLWSTRPRCRWAAIK